MRSLITGATGHLGAALTDALVKRGWPVAITLRSGSNPWRLGDLLSQVVVIPTDLEHISAAAVDIQKFSPQVVFHAGWHGVDAARRDSVEQFTINIPAMLNLLVVAREAGVSRFIGIGSQAEYGPVNAVITEDTPLHPDLAYGISKMTAGQLAESFCRRSAMAYSWLRLFSMYGPRDDARHMLPSLIELLLDGKNPPLSAGTQPWDYLYVDDAVAALILAAEKDAGVGVCNLASGMTYPIRQVVEMVRDQIAPSVALRFGEVPLTAAQLWGIRAEVSKIRRLTGFIPATDLARGLANTIAWHIRRRATDGSLSL